jgi:hypothetical protein
VTNIGLAQASNNFVYASMFTLFLATIFFAIYYSAGRSKVAAVKQLVTSTGEVITEPHTSKTQGEPEPGVKY